MITKPYSTQSLLIIQLFQFSLPDNLMEPDSFQVWEFPETG